MIVRRNPFPAARYELLILPPPLPFPLSALHLQQTPHFFLASLIMLIPPGESEDGIFGRVDEVPDH